MGERSSDEEWAESLKTLLSSNTIKIEPPTVMASSATLKVRVNVDTLLRVVYDLLTRGNSQEARIGVRYEERSTQTKLKPSTPRGVKGTQSLVSTGVQAEDTSEAEKRTLLERQNQILTRSILECHAQYTKHKDSCVSCPSLTFPKELHDMYQQSKVPTPKSPQNPDSATERPSDPTRPPSPIPPDEASSCTEPTSHTSVPMDVDEDTLPQPDREQTYELQLPQSKNTTHSVSPKKSTSPTPLFDDITSPSRTSPATTVTEHPSEAALLLREASVQSDDGREMALVPKAEPEDTVILDIADSPVALAATTEDASVPPQGTSDNEHEYEASPDPPVLSPSEVWWREEMNEAVFNKFLGTRLLECVICETRPNASYKSFNDDDENINAAIQVHFEKEHPDESYTLKRCSNARLKQLAFFK